jgi:hypothetical protein
MTRTRPRASLSAHRRDAAGGSRGATPR